MHDVCHTLANAEHEVLIGHSIVQCPIRTTCSACARLTAIYMGLGTHILLLGKLHSGITLI